MHLLVFQTTEATNQRRAPESTSFTGQTVAGPTAIKAKSALVYVIYCIVYTFAPSLCFPDAW